MIVVIKVKNLKFKNFLGYGNKFTEINFEDFSLNIISGFNGSGKSSICKALFFSLYGTSNNKIKKPNLINIKNKKNLETVVEFENEKNQLINIKRGLKPNFLNLYVDNKIIKEDSNVIQFQKYIEEEIIGIPPLIFKQIILLSANEFKSFFELKPSEKRVFLSDFFNLQYLDKLEKNSFEINKKLNKKFDDLENEEKTILENIEKENKRLLKIDKIDDTIIKENENKIEEINKKLEKIKNLDLDFYNSKLNELIQENDEIQQEIFQLNSEKKLNILDRNCYNCPLSKTISKEDFDLFMRTDEELRELKVQNYEDDILSKNNIIEKNKKEINKIEILLKLNDETNNLIEKQNFLIKQNKNSSTIINLYNEIKDSIEKYTENNQKNKKIKKYYEDLITTSNFIKSEIFNDNGIKMKFFIRKIIPILNKLIFDYLVELDSGFLFKFNDNLEEVIKIFGEEIDYENLSEGQKIKLKMSLVLAFRDLLKIRYNKFSSNIFIIDELLDSAMDFNAVDIFINIIKNKMNQEKINVFLISHNDNIKFSTEINNFYNVRLKNGFSHIELGE